MIDIDDSLFALPAAPAPERRGKRGEDFWRRAGKSSMTSSRLAGVSCERSEAIQRNVVRPTVVDCLVAIARRKTGVRPGALRRLAIDGGSSTLWRRAPKVSATP